VRRCVCVRAGRSEACSSAGGVCALLDWCVCVCVCEREQERERERGRGKERGVQQCGGARSLSLSGVVCVCASERASERERDERERGGEGRSGVSSSAGGVCALLVGWRRQTGRGKERGEQQCRGRVRAACRVATTNRARSATSARAKDRTRDVSRAAAACSGPEFVHQSRKVEGCVEEERGEHPVLCVGRRGGGVEVEGAQREELRLEDAQVRQIGRDHVDQHR
jgi:hypothetical protein